MTISLEQAQALLVHEAALLDDWKTVEWSELFTEDGEYLVPSTSDPEGAVGESLYLIQDDHFRLCQRAIRLRKNTAHVEFPHSRTTRIVSNVSVSEGENGADKVECNFVIYRSKGSRLDIFPGRSIYQVVQDREGDLKIRSKIVKLGVEELRPHGAIGFIL